MLCPKNRFLGNRFHWNDYFCSPSFLSNPHHQSETIFSSRLNGIEVFDEVFLPRARDPILINNNFWTGKFRSFTKFKFQTFQKFAADLSSEI